MKLDSRFSLIITDYYHYFYYQMESLRARQLVILIASRKLGGGGGGGGGAMDRAGNISELVFIFSDSYSMFLSSARDLYDDISLSFSLSLDGKLEKKIRRRRQPCLSLMSVLIKVLLDAGCWK